MEAKKKTEPQKYFVRGEDGEDLGVLSLDELQEWARQDKTSGASVSEDGKTGWRPAAEISALGLEWAVEVKPGRFYGPLHADALETYVSSGQVDRSAPRYRLARGATASPEAKLRDLEAAVAARDAALETMKKNAAASAEETRKTLAALEERLARMHERAGSADAKSAERAAALAKRAEAAENALAETKQKLLTAEAALRDAEAAADSARTECETNRAVWAAEKSALESQLQSLRSQQESLQAEIKRTETDADALKDRLAEIEERGFSASAAAPAPVVTAEIVTRNDAPRNPLPGPAGAQRAVLRDIEKQAQMELAELRGRGGFFGRKKK